MSQVPVDKLSAEEVATLSCTYAALLLHDSEIDVDANKITKLLKVSGVEVESFWPKLFAKTLASKNITELLA
jgi:large subunit ribosomal protein LP1